MLLFAIEHKINYGNYEIIQTVLDKTRYKPVVLYINELEVWRPIHRPIYAIIQEIESMILFLKAKYPRI